MPCPECAYNRQRAERAEVAERLLLLFTDTFSLLSRRLADIEAESFRRYHAENPPPPGAEPIRKRRFLLVPVDERAETTVDKQKADSTAP